MIRFSVEASRDVWRVIAARSQQALDLGHVPEGGNEEAVIKGVAELATRLASTPGRLLPESGLLTARLDSEEVSVIVREIGDWAERLPEDARGSISGPMGADTLDSLAASWAGIQPTIPPKDA